MKQELKSELEFIIKVIRNSLILSGLYFVSVWAVGDLNWQVCKPIIIFCLSYTLTEFTKHYKIDMPNPRKNKYHTLIY